MSLKTKYGKLLIAHKPEFYLNDNNAFYDIFLYGHIHNHKNLFEFPNYTKAINISVENLNYTPNSLKQLLEKF